MISTKIQNDANFLLNVILTKAECYASTAAATASALESLGLAMLSEAAKNLDLYKGARKSIIDTCNTIKEYSSKALEPSNEKRMFFMYFRRHVKELPLISCNIELMSMMAFNQIIINSFYSKDCESPICWHLRDYFNHILSLQYRTSSHLKYLFKKIVTIKDKGVLIDDKFKFRINRDNRFYLNEQIENLEKQILISNSLRLTRADLNMHPLLSLDFDKRFGA